MTNSHYYAREGRQFGPVSLAELQKLLSNGRLAPTDLVWTEGMPDSQPAAKIPGLLPPSTPRGVIHSSSGVARRVADRLERFLAAARLTATATVQHLASLFACGVAQGRLSWPGASRCGFASHWARRHTAPVWGNSRVAA